MLVCSVALPIQGNILVTLGADHFLENIISQGILSFLKSTNSKMPHHHAMAPHQQSTDYSHIVEQI